MSTKKSSKVFTDYSTINMRTLPGHPTVREISEGYLDNSMTDEGGVFSMNGRLNIRPKYQRNYVVEDIPFWKENLINSILCGFPINRIYLGVDENDPNSIAGQLEVLDGQQRIKTICDFVNGDFKITIDGDMYHFRNLPLEKQTKILDYGLDITYCIGDEDARIAWFRRINQPNSILTNQEIRNAIYRGPWVEAAKKYFSATSSHVCGKQILDEDDELCIKYFLTSKAKIERCDYLEYAIDLVAYYNYPELRGKDDKDHRICQYMADHQNDENADELINHYKKMVSWVRDIFFHNGLYSTQTIKSQDWGRIYTDYSNNEYTEEEKKHISQRCEVICGGGSNLYVKSTGIYEWVLRGEKDDEIKIYLDLRGFEEKDKRAMWNSQGGICPLDGKEHPYEEMVAHHINSWKNGGPTNSDNLVMLWAPNHTAYHNHEFNDTPEQLREKRDKLRKEHNNL